MGSPQQNTALLGVPVGGTVILLLDSERTARAWKNGGGTTKDVAVYPPRSGPDDFLWRVSIATIEADSVFSSFPGVDRCLMPLSPGGLVLQDDAGRHPIARYGQFSFAGESAVEAVEVSARSLDLNVMTRRGAFTGSLAVSRVDGRTELGTDSSDARLVVVLEGELALGNDVTLSPYDAVLLDGITATVRGTATVATAALTPLEG